MPSFVHPALLWGLVAVAAPVLIHLINMMRHRRVRWAAMEFLLVSQKKHRTWVLFKQLLLLLLRMTAIAAIVLMVAKPRLQGHLGGLLGGQRTHFIVLLDDSFSMSDRWADTDAFAQAKGVAQRIAAAAARRNRLQSYTLLRFSQAASGPKGSPRPDLVKEPIGSEFAETLAGRLAKLASSQTAAEPLPALQAVGRLLGDNDGEHRILYLVSDFRARQWSDPTDLRKELSRLTESGVELHLVDCVDRARPNLAIVSLAPVRGIRTAGVSWFMEVAVANFGAAPARGVSVTLGEDGHGRPAVTLPEIPAGKVAKGRFEVRFANAGSHRITARLEGDAVAADNWRCAAIDLPTELPVLLIDGDPRAAGARTLNIALAPGGATHTGLRPRIETPRYLNLKPLADFRSINLTNIDRLDVTAVEALEKYVAEGGGAAFFLGDRCDPKSFNDALYRGGKGLFPVPLGREAELPVDRLEPAPDVQVDDHFIFRVFGSKRNNLLQTIAVERYCSVAEGWRPSRDSTTRVLARLRNGAPLVVERRFGKGRVVAFLTSAAPTWNNWARSPSFVVTMLDLQAYLSERPSADESHVVGAPLDVALDPAAYEARIRFFPPENAPAASVQALPSADGSLVASLADVDRSGFYDVKLTRTNGAVESRCLAVNVDPAEGNLALLDGSRLASRLEGVRHQFEQAAAFQSDLGDPSGSDCAETILLFVVLLLLAEQVLAWSASYHLAGPRPSAEGGPA